jgi:zinc transport system ATP-binding protein
MHLTPPTISIKDVGFSFGSTRILHGITSSIPGGAYVGLIGPNGSGKTTLLRLMLGLLRPDRGTILIGNQPPTSTTARKSIGYVPQRAGQSEGSFPVTVGELVASGSIGRPSSLGVHQALAEVGIGHLQHRRIGDLSGGERQRAYIARALLPQPSILLLDEPTSGVDEKAEQQLYALLETLHRRGLTIILVSHDLEAVAQEADRVICINHRLLYDGEPQAFAAGLAAGKFYPTTRQVITHHHAD